MMVKHIDKPMKAKGIVHKMIADTAKGCAREHYDTLARNNRFYKAYPDVDRFVFEHWPKYIHTARQILIGMLASPKYPQSMKDEIYDAVLRDGAVNPKNMATPEKPSFFLGAKR